MKFKKVLCAALAVLMVVGMFNFAFADDVQDDVYTDLTKTAEWTNTEKTSAKITITSDDITGSLKGTVLFLGSLCRNHSLEDEKIMTALAVTAQYANIDYRFWQVNKDTFDVAKAYTGTINKYTDKTYNEIYSDISKLSMFSGDGPLAGSTHHTIYEFAKALENIKVSDYDYVILEFDGFLLGEYTATKKSYPSDYYDTLKAAAAKIKEFYAKNKVMWIVPKPDSGRAFFQDAKFDASASGDVTRKNVRDIVYLMAPEDLDKDGEVVDAKIANQKTLNARINATGNDLIWTTYGDKNGILEFMEKKFGGTKYETAKITDIVKSGFIIDKVTGLFYNESTKKYEENNERFSFTKTGQTVVGTFLVEKYGHTNIRLNIDVHVDDKNDPFQGGKITEVETNEGDAVAEYFIKDEKTPRDTKKAKPPKLEKIPCTVTTSVVGGTISGTTTVADGMDVTVTYSPDEYYELSSVTVDGFSLTGKALTASTSSFKFEAIEKDHEISVVYILPDVNVYFDTQGGAFPESKSFDKAIGKGTKATEPTDDPTRTGYTFDGWYTTSGCTTEFDFDTKITKDTTIYAKWTENDVTITYTTDGNGKVKVGANEAKATDTETVKAVNGTAVGATPVANTGYHFTKWEKVSGTAFEAKDVDGTTKKLTPPKAASGIYEASTYKAFFSKNEYVVDYVMNGHGTQVSDENVLYKEKATEPTDPTELGYTFEGWYTTDKLTTKFDFNTEITENTTLYAKWVEDDVTITYTTDGNGKVKVGEKEAKAEDTETVKAATGKTVGATPVANTGYHFSKWEKVSGTAFEAKDVDGTTKKLTAPKASNGIYAASTYKAFFDKNQYTVSYVMNGHGTQVPDEDRLYKEKATKPEDPTALGYTFEGWYTTDKLATKFDFNTEITENTTLYAKWVEDDVTITYTTDGNGKVKVGENEAKATDTETVKAATGKTVGATPVANTGYHFSKWEKVSGTAFEAKDVDGTTKKLTAPKAASGIYAASTYKAFFEKNEYTVDFITAHGTKPQDQTVKYQEKATNPGNLTEEGYEFQGWYTDNTYETAFSFDTLITEDTTVYGKWKVIVTFLEPKGPDTKSDKEVIEIGDNPEDPTEEPEGYDLEGLYTDPEFENEFNPEDPVDEPTTVYPKWVEKTAPIHYDVNGGETPEDNIDEMMKYTKKTGVTTYVPNRPGFIFKGWATTLENANNGVTDYAAKDTYKNANVVPTEATLYAVWQEDTDTGDERNLTLWYIAMALSLMAGAAVVFFKKKEY